MSRAARGRAYGERLSREMSTSSEQSEPEEIRPEIEATRANLSQNVNALGDAVTPGGIAKRQAEKAAGVAVGLKDKVMGSVEDAAGTVSSGTSDLSDAVAVTPQALAARSRGNPMAAGLIALGAGWLLGSLLPASAVERQAAAWVKEKAEPLVSELQEVAKEAAANLKEPAQEAMDAVKQTAQEAVAHMKEEGRASPTKSCQRERVRGDREGARPRQRHSTPVVST